MFKSKVKYTALMLILLISFPSMVNAKSTEKNEICINSDKGSNFYSITKKGKSVIPFYITDADINGSTKVVNGKKITYPKQCYCSRNSEKGNECLKKEQKKDELGNLMVDENNQPIMEATSECATDYEFETQSQALACKISNSTANSYEFYICPGNNSYDVVQQMQSGMKIEYVSSSNQYKVTFSVPSSFKGKVSAKLVKKVKIGEIDKFDINSTTGLPNNNSSVDENYSTSAVDNGIYFKPDSEFYFIFYLDDISDGCNGERLGYIMGAVPSTVPNPMYNDPICTDFRSKYTSGSIERLMVSDCDSEKIQYSELNTIRNSISKKIDEVVTMHKDMSESSVDASNNFTCLFKNNSSTINQQIGFSNKKGFLDIPGTGTYWKAFCTETISVEYDDPKVSKAGMGFGYSAKFVVNRQCTPIKISEPKFLDSCKYSVECWGGPANHHGENGAGPNEDFDSCVNSCDGGTYTQNCINSCYSKIYGKNVSYSYKTNFKDYSFLNASSNSYKTLRLATANKGNPNLIGTTDGGATNLPISSGCVISGNNIDNGCGTSCTDNTTCTTEHKVTFTYLNSCNSNGQSTGTKCYEVYTNWPCDDSNSYKKKIEESEQEYKDVISAIEKFSNSTIEKEKYEIIVDEDYDRQTNGTYKSKTTKFSNKDGNYKILSEETIGSTQVTYKSSTNLADVTKGNLDQTYINEHVTKKINEYKISRTVTVSIGAAYVSKVNGNDVVYNKSNTNTDTSYDKNPNYYPAQNKYFTQLDTRIINNYKNWPYYNKAVVSDSTDAYTKNIHVRFYNIGSWNQWGTEGNGVNIDCLYGTDSGLIPPPDDPDDPPCPDGECPEKTPPTTTTQTPGTGFRYIFRPITLTDMFPNNRNARFNWTGTITSDGKATNAALTKDKSGYSYAVDPEKLISSIQSKGYSIYTDSSEVDYEFTLTKENIRNIRKYNKSVKDYNNDGSKNYLDYNMSCYTNAKQQVICTSKFLDNVNGNSGTESSASNQYITYDTSGKSMDERKAIAGCNNSKNNECSDN